MNRTAENWPIAVAMLWAEPAHDAGPERWESDLREVHRLGFTEFDPTDTWVRLADLSSHGRRTFSELVNDIGLTMPALSTSRRSPIDSANGAENLAYCHRVIDTAAEFGIPTVSVGLFGPLEAAQRAALWFWTAPGAINEPNLRPLAIQRVRELTKHGREVGVAVSIEMYEDTFVGTADSAVRFVEDIDDSNIGLNPDIANLVRLHRPVENWRSMLEKVLPVSNYWHVKNYTRDEDALTGAISTSPAPLLGGIIDYRWGVQFALQNGFHGAFCVEHYGGDGLGVCAANRDYIRGVLPFAMKGQLQ